MKYNPRRAIIISVLMIILLASCADQKEVNGSSVPGLETQEPIPSSTPAATETLIPTATSTPTPTITPTPAPTQIGGGSGKILASCRENSDLMAMFIYDISSEEFSLANPQFNRSYEDVTVWTSDELILLSPENDLVIWEKCDYENVEYAGYPPKLINQENISCDQYISQADFSTTIELPQGVPQIWQETDLAFFYDLSGDRSLYSGDPRTYDRTLLTTNLDTSTSPAISPTGELIFTPVYGDSICDDDFGCSRKLTEIVITDLKNGGEYIFQTPEIIGSEESAYDEHIARIEGFWSDQGSKLVLKTIVIEYQKNAMFDGRIVPKVKSSYSGPLFLIDFEGEPELKNLIDKGKMLWLSPDGLEIILYQYVPEYYRSQLYRYFTESGELVELDLDPVVEDLIGDYQRFRGTFSLSPDETKFTFAYYASQNDPDRINTYLVDMETGDWRLLNSHVRKDLWQTVSWSPDSQWLFINYRGRDSRYAGDPFDYQTVMCDLESCKKIQPANTVECVDLQWLGPLALDTGYQATQVPLEETAKTKNLIGELSCPISTYVDNYIFLDNSESENWYGHDGQPISLDQGFSVTLQMDSIGENSISLSGRTNSPETEWWEGIHRMYIRQYSESTLVIELRDGETEDSSATVYVEDIPRDEPFTIEFPDPAGTRFNVLNSDGDVLAEFVLSDPDLFGSIKMPEGLFPDGDFYPGVLMPPGDSLKVFGFRFDVIE